MAPTAPRERSVDTTDLLPLVYDELRELARAFLRSERPDHTLQATALVHEIYLRLCGQRRQTWRGRAEFFDVATRMIRRVLVNHHKAREAAKRGGCRRADRLVEEPVDPRAPDLLDLIALDDLLRRLAVLDARQARIVELRLFGGFGTAEIARMLEVSERTVSGEWALARAWLRVGLARTGTR